MTEKSNNSIRRNAPRKTRKPKKSQIPQALLVLILMISFGYYLYNRGGASLSTFWIFGILFGYVLQRGRFCFTAGFRDPFISGGTSVSRAILVALGIGTVGFTANKFYHVLNDTGIDISMSGVAPIGLPLALGAIIFGVGMVIAGGCASGTVMRVGEGFTMQMISLFFFIAGSLWGAHDMGFWGKFNENAPKIFLPDVFGWFGALVIQLAIIVLLYIAAVKWQRKKMGSDE